MQRVMFGLSGPTAAAVGALMAGAAADLALRPAARCASYYMQPYDDDVWQAEHSFHDEQLGLPAAVAVSKALVKAGKAQRPIGVAALQRVFAPRNVLITYARNEALTCILVLHNYFEAMNAEEELALAQGREPDHIPFPTEAMRVAARRGFFNGCMDWTTQLVRALLDWAASRRLPAGLSAKLVKELRASVQRKAQYRFLYRGARVFRTSLLSEATHYLADYIVTVSLEVYMAVAARGRKGAAAGAQRARRLAARGALHALRCGMLLVTVSAANGVGSMSPFKRPLAMFLLAQLSGLAVNIYMIPLIDSLTGGPAAGPAPAAAPEAAAAAGPGTAPQPAIPAAALRAAPAEPVVAAPGAGGAVAEAAVQAGAAALVGGVAEAAVQADAAGGQQQQQAEQEGQQEQQQRGRQEAGVQADEPPVPAPQQRRPVVGGPRLPERRARRNGAIAPPPQAPHTPQFREPRAPSPAPDSEDAEAAAAATVPASSSGAAGAGSSGGVAGAGSSGGVAGAGGSSGAAVGAEPRGRPGAAAAAEQQQQVGLEPAASVQPQAAPRPSVDVDQVAVLGEL